MRQSLSFETEVNDTPEGTARGPAGAVLLAIALTLVFVTTAVVDHIGPQSLSDHATALYRPHAEAPSTGLLYGMLYTVAGLAVLLWVTALRSTRARKGFTVATILVAVTINTCLAAALLVSTEYGTRVFPPVWGILAALPSAAGLLAVALRIRRG